MSKFVRTFPVVVEFIWNPEEMPSEAEEGCEEEFGILSFSIGGEDVLPHIGGYVDEVVLKYLKESKDDV